MLRLPGVVCKGSDKRRARPRNNLSHFTTRLNQNESDAFRLTSGNHSRMQKGLGQGDLPLFATNSSRKSRKAIPRGQCLEAHQSEQTCGTERSSRRTDCLPRACSSRRGSFEEK